MRELGRLPHPGGRVLARWNGRETGGKVAPDGSYRLKVSLSGRNIELLNPLALDTAVRVQSTHVSRRVISPDCDSYGDRVIVVVRGNEQLAGLRHCRCGRARASCAPYASGRRAGRSRSAGRPTSGKRCTTAPDGPYRLRVIARDVPGNTRAVDLGAITARGVVLAPPDRSIVAGRRVRIGISADARGLRLELARLGDGAPQILARGDAGAGRDRACPGRGARRRLRRLQPPRRAHLRGAAGRARRASGARRLLLVSGQPASVLLPFQRRLDALGIRFDAITAQRPARGRARRLQGRRRAGRRRKRRRALGHSARDAASTASSPGSAS